MQPEISGAKSSNARVEQTALSYSRLPDKSDSRNLVSENLQAVPKPDVSVCVY